MRRFAAVACGLHKMSQPQNYKAASVAPMGQRSRSALHVALRLRYFPVEEDSAMTSSCRSCRVGALMLAASFALMCQTAAAGAQIYEWADDTGDRHFANSLDEVPPDERDAAKVVVGAPTRAYDAPAPGPATPTPVTNQPAESGPGQAERDDDSVASASGWEAGFAAGFEAGRRAAAAEEPICPAEPSVVVLENPPPVTVNVPRYDPTGAYYRPPDVGPLAGPFDDGASLGRTHRDRIQDMRALERGW
jgi:hypothetical protein